MKEKEKAIVRSAPDGSDNKTKHLKLKKLRYLDKLRLSESAEASAWRGDLLNNVSTRF